MVLALLAAAHPQGALAATTGSCTINVTAGGVLKPNATLTTLSTKNPGGSAGRASITAAAGGMLPSALCLIGLPLNCMQVSISTPSSFSSAPAGNTNVTLVGTFSQVGSSSFLNLLSLVILNGTYSFDFDLTATKLSGSFGAGTYQATQTIRCE
ncbi:hypothetical protein ASG54_01325 [Aureimonas sp. Leaf460]|nr:hypothetical protein ASG62_04055 [Aureimonas sp. Leaf427]KQT81362.1 hypothetical protein ASG54_01325 [Aureimonas sp. Leaf460]